MASFLESLFQALPGGIYSMLPPGLQGPGALVRGFVAIHDSAAIGAIDQQCWSAGRSAEIAGLEHAGERCGRRRDAASTQAAAWELAAAADAGERHGAAAASAIDWRPDASTAATISGPASKRAARWP